MLDEPTGGRGSQINDRTRRRRARHALDNLDVRRTEIEGLVDDESSVLATPTTNDDFDRGAAALGERMQHACRLVGGCRSATDGQNCGGDIPEPRGWSAADLIDPAFEPPVRPPLATASQLFGCQSGRVGLP